MSEVSDVIPRDVATDVMAIISETLEIDLGYLSTSSRLIESDLDLSSLQLIEIVVAIERTLDVGLGDELMQIENFATVQTLSNAVGRVLEQS